jgi:GNAT superfamily N-acetyltransferase
MVEVRTARPADMAEVGKLSRELAAHVLDPDPGNDVTPLSNCCFGPDRWIECLVAVMGTEIVAFATYCRIFEAHTREKRFWMGDLYVQQASRSKGVGRALVAALQDRATEVGCAGISLELARGNVAGQLFYERLGARRCEQVDVLRLSAMR